MSTSQEASWAKRTRRRVIGLSLVTVMAVGGLSGLLYLRGQASRGNYAMAEQVVPDMAPALQEARMKKAQALRDKWKGWALEHKGILKKMLNGSQSDQEAVWNTLPMTPSDPKSITLLDVHNGLARYTWNSARRGVILHAVGIPAKQMEREKFLERKYLNEYFQQYRDIQISMSCNAGKKTIGLWASGRITETETMKNPYESGKPVFREETRELVPPYDFLTN